MTRRLFGLLGGAGLFLASIATPAAMAQQVSYYNYQLYGVYAIQFVGSVNLPAPLNGFNGPFSRNGKVTFDGFGNVSAVVIANYNGTISHDTFSGTYVVNSDGTFTVTVNNVALPFLPPGTPNTLGFDGILSDNGHAGKLTLDAIAIGGQAQPNVGSVITGLMNKQTY